MKKQYKTIKEKGMPFSKLKNLTGKEVEALMKKYKIKRVKL